MKVVFLFFEEEVHKFKIERQYAQTCQGSADKPFFKSQQINYEQ